MATDANLACRSCGALFDSPAGNADCPKPNGVRPLYDCGKGGHWFDVDTRSQIAASTARAARESLDPTAFHLMCLAETIDADIFVARHRGELAEHDLLQAAQDQLAVLRALVERARGARTVTTPDPTNG